MQLTSERHELEQKFYTLCSEVVESKGLKLYDLDYISSSNTLRLFIYDEKSGTAQMQDCVSVDKAMTDPIENESWMPEVLNLEVSSPGVYKKLRTAEHFKMAVGETITVILTSSLDEKEQEKLPVNLRKEKKLTGKLVNFDEDKIVLSIEDNEIGIEIEKIKKAQVDPSFDELNKEFQE